MLTLPKLILVAALTLPAQSYQAKVSPYVWYAQTELRCLADNVYHEARGESKYGQALVAKVTLNRAKKMNESICATVYKPYQFSWTIPKKKPKTDRYSIEYTDAMHAAYAAQLLKYNNLYYYHTKAVKPKWSKTLPKRLTHGNHIFYNENPSSL